MKHICTFVLFLILSVPGFAQFRLGAKIGIGFADLTHTSDKALYPLYTFNGGIVANYIFSPVFSLQSEMLLSTLATKFTQHSSYTNVYGNSIQTDEEIKIRLQYLEIPLLAKFTIFNKQKVNINLLAGAFGGYCLSSKQKTENDSFRRVSSDYSAFNAGYSFGIGLSCMQQRLFFELRGNRGLVNIHTTGDEKINTIQMNYTVGYFLFNKTK